MSQSLVCMETENQSLCVTPEEVAVLTGSSTPDEPAIFATDPEQTAFVETWTPRDQVEWNRIATMNDRSSRPHSPLGMRPPKALGIPFILAGCGGDSGGGLPDPSENEPTPEEELIDQDGDGFYSNGEDAIDCDDSAVDVNLGAQEVRGNNVDENCNGNEDADMDGDDHSVAEGDCDDENAAIRPDMAVDACDGLDNNCDGRIDETCASHAELDDDGDGYCEDENETDSCVDGSLPGDCDDEDPTVHPGVSETCSDGMDNNCNGEINEGCAADEEAMSCDESPSAFGPFWFEECCPDEFNQQSGPEGRYGSDGDHDSVSGFSEPIEDDCNRLFPGTANSLSFVSGDSFWIDSENAEAFCLSQTGAVTGPSSCVYGTPTVSPYYGSCETFASELAVAKISLDDAGRDYRVNVNCGRLDDHDIPRMAVFAQDRPSTGSCFGIGSPLLQFWYEVPGDATIEPGTEGVIYFAAAGPVPFSCHVSLE